MRNEIADGLKTLALLGVFMVNGLGYALAPHYPLQIGAPTPLDSTLAQSVHALALTLFMGKALPFLTFLFGYSMASFAAQNNKSLKRRYLKLLLIGLLHGVLVYFGDILTSYALIGLLLTSTSTRSTHQVFKRWQFWSTTACALLGFWLWHAWRNYVPIPGDDVFDPIASFGNVHIWSAFWALNASAYGAQMVGWALVFLPLHLCLFLTGALAARLRWLTPKPLLPYLFLRSWLYNSWWVALTANAVLGFASIHAHNQYTLYGNVSWIALLNIPLGVWLVASALTKLMHHIQSTKRTPRLLVWLASAGRHTLMMYLGLSVVLMLLGRLGLFRTGTAWNHTALWALALVLMWLFAVMLGKLASARGMRDPMSRWLSRP